MLAFAVTVMDAPALMTASSAGPGAGPIHEVPALKLPPEDVLKITAAKAAGAHSKPTNSATIIGKGNPRDLCGNGLDRPDEGSCSKRWKLLLEWKTTSPKWDKHRKPLPLTTCPPFSNGTSFIVRFGWL